MGTQILDFGGQILDFGGHENYMILVTNSKYEK